MADQSRALSSSGVVVGENVGERIRGMMRNIAKRDEERELERRKAAERWKYEKHDTIWVFVKRHEGSGPTQPPTYTAETVSQVPGVGAHAKTDRHNSSPRMALADLRLKLAQLWSARRVAPDYEAARARAAKVEFRQAIVAASDEAGA